MKSSQFAPAVSDKLQRLGADIDLARKRRLITVSLLCEAARITPQTYRRLVRGEPGVSLGVMTSVLHALNLEHHLDTIAAPQQDALGIALERRKQAKRIHPRGGLDELDTDF